MSRDDQALALLDELLDLPPAQRESRLASIAAHDAQLADTVAAWLRADARTDARLDDGPVAARLGLQAPLPAPGQRIGAYRLVRELGRGGMGQVWLGERVDGDFRQQVAIKLAHPAIGGSEGEARFRRERQILAGLRHPHIAQLLDGGLSPDGRAWLAMEWVEGQSLRDILRQGSLPPRRVMAIGVQVAEALAHAHGAGVVHRDLKPENILLTPDGYAKVLDFGIAKLLGDGTTDAHYTAETAPGQILGTVAYMSPEQACGRPVDFRSDQFALGAVLYELATGSAAFARDTQRETLTAVMLAEPAGFDGGPPALPAGLLPVLRRCLSKEPGERYAATLDLAHDLKAAAAGITTSGPVVPMPAARRPRSVMAFVAGAAFALLGALAWQRSRPPPAPISARSLHADIALSPAQKLSFRTYAMHAIGLSPDGRRLVFSGLRDGERRLYVRELDARDAVVLPGSDSGSDPVFSPDGEWVAFFSAQKLMKIAVAGGGPSVLAEAPNALGGISWAQPDRILFSPHPSAGIWEVAADGGTPRAVTHPDVAAGEASHVWPSQIPGSPAFLYVAEIESADSFDAGRIYAFDPRDNSRTLLVDGGSDARVVGDELFYVRAGSIFALAFDRERLKVSGSPRQIASGVMYSPAVGAAQFATTRNVRVHVPGAEGWDREQPVRIDRRGNIEPIDMPAAVHGRLRVSRDGKRAVFGITAADDDLWVYDFERRVLTRVTNTDENIHPAWTPDGQSLIYAHHGTPAPPPPTLYRRRADGTGEPELLLPPDGNLRARLYPDVSPDGREVIYGQYTIEHNFDLWILDLETRQPRLWLRTPASDIQPRYSPDGRWIAWYSSPSFNQPGQVYVQSARGESRRWQITTAGGSNPEWRRDSRALFFWNEGSLYEVELAAGDDLAPGAPKPVLSGDFVMPYDVFPDGDHFLMLQRVPEPGAAGPIRLQWLTTPDGEFED
jgi:Tol biopolymer transport system component